MNVDDCGGIILYYKEKGEFDMSQKLPVEKSRLSLYAIQQYILDFPGTNIKKVIVRNKNDVIFNENINVIAGDYNIYFKVDIMWEDVEFDFKQKGLYGTYSSTYYEIEYEERVLTIYSNDIVIEII